MKRWRLENGLSSSGGMRIHCRSPFAKQKLDAQQHNPTPVVRVTGPNRAILMDHASARRRFGKRRISCECEDQLAHCAEENRQKFMRIDPSTTTATGAPLDVFHSSHWR